MTCSFGLGQLKQQLSCFLVKMGLHARPAGFKIIVILSQQSQLFSVLQNSYQEKQKLLDKNAGWWMTDVFCPQQGRDNSEHVSWLN